MTDEERAKEIVRTAYASVASLDQQARDCLEHLRAIRADERERCCRELESITDGWLKELERKPMDEAVESAVRYWADMVRNVFVATLRRNAKGERHD